mmetsp:Transcript_48983/g.118622  ORF Transcript_48983/g.118622 Transcript_48983/m.118622 type:complete len:176 (-) Transcript_48983:2169-2696(-)
MSSEGDYVQQDGVETGVNTAQESSSTPGGNRKSHVLCGRFADSRKGVLFVDAFNIFAIIFSLLFKSIVFHERHFGGYFAGLLGIILSCIGAYGAIKWDYKITAIASLGFAACFLLDFVFLNPVGVIIGLGLLYPHAMFTYENYRGVLTKQTYSSEEYLMPGVPDVSKKVDSMDIP